MAVKFTEEQQNVINLRRCNILVSAAAGSGKTAVLVERIVQMVCDPDNPVDIDRLLVVTFTKAAAAEMRERVAQRLAQMLQDNAEDAHLQRQATLVHNAQICTIDSFCVFLLRNHFNEIGLDPAFRMLDDGELKLIQKEAMAELLEEAFAAGDEDFHYCVECFCHGGRESVLEEFIASLAQFASSYPWPEDWLNERKQDCLEMTPEAFEQSPCGQYMKEFLSRSVRGFLPRYARALQLCDEPDGPYMYGAVLEQEMELLKTLASSASLLDFEKNLSAVAFSRLPSCRDNSVSSDKKELAQKLRKETKEEIEGLQTSFFSKPLIFALKENAMCGRAVTKLLDLTIEYLRKCARLKSEKKAVDFSDVEHLALHILLEKDEQGEIRPSKVAKDYRRHFVEVMIDEYQDSNLIQELLLQSISGEDEGNYNRFLVGDVKQSIYKFRLSRPEIFIEKYNRYTEDGELRRIDLAKNFRSREGIIDAVNDVFYRLMSVENGGVAYDQAAALYAKATYPEITGAETELFLVEKPKKGSDLNDKRAEAIAIGHQIKRLRRSFRVTEKGSATLRALRYSDIVILLRSGSGWDEEFKNTLEEMGIPVHLTAKTGYFSATEVQTLLQYLRVLDNCHQDIPMFGAMKSVFGGFTDEEMALLRSGDKKISLYENLKNYTENDDLQKKIQTFLDRIEKYRACAVYMPIRELLTKVIDEFDYMNYVTALPAGSKRRGNVEMLLVKAGDFEKTSYTGLFHFVRYMEQLEKYNVDYGEADELDENADVVRIMTIHKSKGLEFPVVFLAGMSKGFNMMDTSKAVITEAGLGVAVNYVDPVRRLRSVPLSKQIVAAKIREDNIAEEMRLLYVAMTRAREKLILMGTVKDAEKKLALYEREDRDHISYGDFFNAKCYLDFILPIVHRCAIRVWVKTVEEGIKMQLREQLSVTPKLQRLKYARIKADAQISRQLRERLQTVYHSEYLKDLYTKTTVSELKIAAMSDKDEEAYHTFEEREVEEYIPRFRRETEEVTGTVRGNAYHRAMEFIDFAKVWEGIMGLPGQVEEFLHKVAQDASIRGALRRAVAECLQKEVDSKRMPEEYVKILRMDKLVNFLCSNPGYRMWKAQVENQLYREQPFVLGIPARRLKEEFPEGETVLIQGIIDVFWEEDGELVLLDYKTDRIESIEALWDRYATQIDYYKEALERIMAKPVKAGILYSFHLERFE
ncbi:MAG: helicase-exonuclease AddAB subunit AddA [Lachnospiraceae bacterium]|nr:helicase-exonuclease AddAB subunit AddA [Lachnospiraceae bacterium]